MVNLITLLRLVHIIAAFVWFGLAVTSTLFIEPAASLAGEAGTRYMKYFYNHTAIKIAFPASAGITTLVGILLYFTGDPATNFSNLGRFVLGVGAVFGIIATLHGGAITGRMTGQLSGLLMKYVTDSPALPTDGMILIRELFNKIRRDTRVGLALTTIALVAMASARYL